MRELTIPAIRPLDAAAMAKCRLRLDNLTKPLGSLHSFEHLAVKMAGITGEARPRDLRACLVLMNGSLRTAGLCDSYAAGVSAGLRIFDVFGETLPDAEQAAGILEQGFILGEAAAAESKAVGLGMVGRIPEAATCEILAWHSENGKDPLDELIAAGSPELAGMAGVILGAASGGAAVVLDGMGTALAALLAAGMNSGVKDYLICSHFEPGPSHRELLKSLGLSAYLALDMDVGEGVGAALGISLIQASLHVLNDMKTFGDAQVHVAEDGPGALVQSPDIRDC